MKKSRLTAEETARLVASIITEETIVKKELTHGVMLISLNFRMMGVSPMQTAPDRKTLVELSQVRNVLVELFRLCSYVRLTRSVGTAMVNQDTRLLVCNPSLWDYVVVRVFLSS